MEKVKEQSKLKYLIDIIKGMDIKDKLLNILMKMVLKFGMLESLCLFYNTQTGKILKR